MPFSLLQKNSREALIVSKSRRNTQIITSLQEELAAKIPRKIADLTVGDIASYQIDAGQAVITSVRERKNCLVRSYRKTKKVIAANIDMLFIVSAVPPLFNTVFIDRVLAVCRLQQIPHTLIVNKTDLGLNDAQPILNIYQKLDVPMIFSSTKTKSGLEGIEAALTHSDIKIAVLAGVSGVGKSSILNRLVPSAQCKVGQLSEKTGKGKQTTSQSIGYLYPDAADPKTLIIDLPGVQNFGIAGLMEAEVIEGFVEFEAYKGLCEYLDCCHLKEPNCAVKAAIEKGEISDSRYCSYLSMLEEIEQARDY